MPKQKASEGFELIQTKLQFRTLSSTIAGLIQYRDKTL